MIDLELYRAFHTVAKAGSLTAAAKELFVSQPALSQSIMNLEHQLGGRLFVRTPRGMTLTPEGEKMLEYVERALNMLDNAKNSFEEMKNIMTGSIRIGASDTLCRHFLLGHIRTFHEMYPEVIIRVTNRTSEDTLSLLRAGQVDVAFVNLPIGEDEFSVRECMALHDCFVGGGKYRHIKNLSKKELTSLPFIMMETASNTRRFFDRHMQSRSIKITPEFELGSFDLVVEFARAGLGIGCVTREFVENELESGELKLLNCGYPLPPRAVGAVTLRDVPPTFAAGRFLSLV